MRQILYISRSKTPVCEDTLDDILERSRHNNAIDGVTGLLWTDGARFLQVVEGPKDSVAAVFARIVADLRHEAIEVLRDRPIKAREFGSWAMAHRDREDTADAFDTKMRRALSRALPETREASSISYRSKRDDRRMRTTGRARCWPETKRPQSVALRAVLSHGRTNVETTPGRY